MKRVWGEEELVEQFTLLPHERPWLGKKTGHTRLGWAVLLKCFQYEGRFPKARSDVPTAVVAHIAPQVDVPPEAFSRYDWSGRSIKYHRAQIRTLLGFREATVDDGEALVAWLVQQVLPQEHTLEQVTVQAYQRLRKLSIEPPSSERLDRLIHSAFHTYERQFCQAIGSQLSSATRKQIDLLLTTTGPDEEPETEARGDEPTRLTRSLLNQLKAEPGRPGLDSMFTEIEKLQHLRQLQLPSSVFQGVSSRVLQAYRQRILVEELHEIRRHPDPLRYTLVAIYCWLRIQEVTDHLVDVLIQLVHRIQVKAERRVERELIGEIKRVAGKNGLLCQLAEAALEHPEGIVRDVLFPVVNEQTLREVVKEFKAQGPTYREQVYTIMRASYTHHYRRMTPTLLEHLEFRSNNEQHQPVIQALAILKQNLGQTFRSYDPATIPLDGVVRSGWRELLIETDARGNPGIDRIKYEICVWHALREGLRCREIWVVGAKRFGNPDEDLPADFETQRPAYYAALKLPLHAEDFIAPIQQELAQALSALDQELPNDQVKILSRAKGRIVLSPLEPLPPPSTISQLKQEVAHRWPMTSLLDVLKETDLRVGFTPFFKSPTGREAMDPATLQKRLLLCLYGLGTNTGLKRVSAGHHGESYADLFYVRRRFITPAYLRQAIIQVANAIFRARVPQFWGEGTTACASDAKRFGAWDQNLLTEWHVRYGGRGVMIYWHVEKNSTCIFSQLKTCSSSEVAAMIEGLLRHATTAEIAKNYVDSHGQSEIAFAFCSLLGFDLLPRLKAIHHQKLYLPEAGTAETFPHLQPVLTRPIQWERIHQQYDQMVKYATALRLGTAQTDDLLRRFTRNNLKHPTYQALAELGKARKTIFLCRYLRWEALRREIQEGLNVIENWNSANDFILYGKGGELASSRPEDQEITMLALHLLQISLVFINTLMIQDILAEPQWGQQMTSEDLRALTPLIYAHINPYGSFNLNMDERLAL